MTGIPTAAEQKAQGAACGCRGSDELCVCQNVVTGSVPSLRTVALELLRVLRSLEEGLEFDPVAYLPADSSDRKEIRAAIASAERILQ